jgi:hypothetical protein
MKGHWIGPLVLVTFDSWELRGSDVPLLSRRGVAANLATTPNVAA